MKAIILAAGIGKRLKPLTEKLPKCLIELGGRTLLERHLSVLAGSGIEEAVIVVGHKKDKIISRIGNDFNGLKIIYVENSDFKLSGSGYSLRLGLKEAKDEVLFMDGDIAYEPGLLKDFISDKSRDALLVGNDHLVDEEGVKVLVDGDLVKEIGKITKSEHKCVGESVGVVRLSTGGRKILMKTMDAHVDRGDIDFEWEHVLNESLDELNLKYVSAKDHKWVEIDFEGDIEKAKRITEA